MTVKELKEAIANLPDEMEVFLQKDPEGNGYSPLAGTDFDAVYVPNSNSSGDVYSIAWTAEDACMSEDDWEEIKSKPRILILYPEWPTSIEPKNDDDFDEEKFKSFVSKIKALYDSHDKRS